MVSHLNSHIHHQLTFIVGCVVVDVLCLAEVEQDTLNKGCKRTGCVGCGFGCYATDDERFRILFQLYPKYYEMVMNYTNNGHTYREAVRKVLQVTGKELPDENGEIYFNY